MGSNDFGPDERPQHDVSVPGFWIDRHPVTVREFEAFVDATGYVTAAERNDALPGPLVFHPPARRVSASQLPDVWHTPARGASWSSPGGAGSSVLGCEDDPVVQVTHRDAHAFASWAGKSLPTEAEWERAARGGLQAKTYAWGDDAEPGGHIKAHIWHGDFPWQNLLTDSYFWTSPVETFAPNRFGLYDMIGNVWEWTDEGYAALPEGAPLCCPPVFRSAVDGDGDAELRVVKGGSFLCSETCRHYRPAARFGLHASTAACNVGFRCVVRPPAGS
jgi:formylglycine-generating enzyme